MRIKFNKSFKKKILIFIPPTLQSAGFFLFTKSNKHDIIIIDEILLLRFTENRKWQ